MRVLALVPPDACARRPARYSFLAEELSAMAAAGVQVHCVSPFVSRLCVLDGVSVHPIPRMRNLMHTLRSIRWLRSAHGEERWVKRLGLSRILRSVASVLEQEQVDIVYSPFAWPSNSAGVPASIYTNTPVVASLRGVDILVEETIGYGRMLDPIARNQMQRTLQRVDHLIGVSRALVDCGIALGADAKRVSVVLKGTHDDKFHDGDRQLARVNLGLANRPTVLFVGNLIPRKGMYCLIKAFEELKNDLPEVQLLMCGDGPEMEPVQQAVREARLEDSVVLAGQVDRETMPEYFRACDVFVLPSLTEGSGNVLVEASATARPCVGTNVAGIPDYIDDGDTGLLFEKNNSADLAGKLLTILQDAGLAARMGHAGRERVERSHRYDHMIDQLLTIFRQVIEGRSGQSTSKEIPTPLVAGAQVR